MDRTDAPTKITYPVWGWILLITAFGLMIGLLVYQARYITVQLDRQNKQLANARLTNDLTRPLADDVRPLAREARPLVSELRPLAREARPALRDTRSLVRELDRFQAPESIAAAGALAKQLDRGSRLIELIDRADRITSELVARGTVEDIERAAEIGEDVRTMTRELLGLQRDALGTLEQSLAIQQATLEHIRAIDGRTGGSRQP